MTAAALEWPPKVAGKPATFVYQREADLRQGVRVELGLPGLEWFPELYVYRLDDGATAFGFAAGLPLDSPVIRTAVRDGGARLEFGEPFVGWIQHALRGLGATTSGQGVYRRYFVAPGRAADQPHVLRGFGYLYSAGAMRLVVESAARKARG